MTFDVAGLASLPGFAIGLFVGGLIMRKFKLQGEREANQWKYSFST